MAIIEKNIFDQYDKEIALALGFFDSVHLGHCSLIEECKNSGYTPAVFTFANSPDEILGKSATQCYTYPERVKILDRLGVGLVVNANFDDKFMHLTGKEFLDTLFYNFNIKLLIVGSDFRCGYHAGYSTEEIIRYCNARGIDCLVKELLQQNGTKLASRDIKVLISEGEIKAVNQMLPFPYCLTGRVERGRGVGSSLVGFPTVNISYPTDKVKLKAGVYASNVIINGKKYKAITNVGEHPTFDDYIFNVESCICDFDAEIYDHEITVEFLDYYRGVKKFDSVRELSEQVARDMARLLAE